MEHFKDLQKAQDWAKWLCHKYRQQEAHYGVVHGPDDDYVVCDTEMANELETGFITEPVDYSNMSYDHIRSIRSDEKMLNFWEETAGAFSAMHGETLRFLLKNKVPIDKWICYELASRGYDENHQWVGFDTAEKIWLTDN